jgi:membrane-associated phospholipid phosphatase
MSLRNFWEKIVRNLLQIFRGYNLIWHLLAITLTFIIVRSGFDWTYFRFFYGTPLYRFLFSVGIIGALVPILLPLITYIIGKVKKNTILINTALALAQAAMLGSFISSAYKAFTGRAHPVAFADTPLDVTRIFEFGFWRAGIFWGWPSSHTTIAFAMSLTLIMLFPQSRKISLAAWVYAFFIGIGVSMTFHWFSDFVAGAIIGTVIGIVVGKSFYKQTMTN